MRIANHVIAVITFARFANCHRRPIAIATAIASRTIEIPSARGYVHKRSLIK